MDKKHIRTIDVQAQRIYWTMEKLKNIYPKEEKVDYAEQLKEVLERGLAYAKSKKEEKK